MKKLGKTGLKVSVLSFGASALGGVFHAVDEKQGIRAVHAALDAGINYFDVAPAYGGTLAETVLGKALKDIPRERYFLSTKAGKYTKPGAYGNDRFDYTEKTIRSGLDASMQRLGVDYLDIVHLHDFEYQNGRHVEAAFAKGFPTLVALKSEGRIGAVGAGIYTMDVWQRVIKEAPVDVILMHNHYCLNDTRGIELVAPCAQINIGIINASPFASGLLTGSEIASWHPAGPQHRQLLNRQPNSANERAIHSPSWLSSLQLRMTFSQQQCSALPVKAQSSGTWNGIRSQSTHRCCRKCRTFWRR